MSEHYVAAIVALLLKLTSASPDDVQKHVDAAMDAATRHAVPVELLLGMGFIESRYNANALSRLECVGKVCKRVTGAWNATTKPPNAKPPWFCGPLQSGGHVPWDDCQKMRADVTYGYNAGARELVIWMNVRECRNAVDKTRCALAGYGAGYPGVKIASTMAYPSNVLGVAAKLRAFALKRSREPKS